MTYSAIPNKEAKTVLLVDSNGVRKTLSLAAKPVMAIVQGDELHVTMEAGHMDVFSIKTCTRLRTIFG